MDFIGKQNVKCVRKTGEAAVEVMCIDFLNSDWRDWRGTGRPRENRLDSQEWVEAFLQKWGLAAPWPPEEPIRTQLLELRETMRHIVEKVAGGAQAAPEELAALNRAMALAPDCLRIDLLDGAYRLKRTSPVTGWELVMARVAGSFAELLATEDVRRIKICDNPDCRWIYFDESRNRVRRWCDDKACGNLMKVRRFRQRQKHNGQEG